MGGIGCGKTAVTDLLAAHGATVIDADVIAREVVEPGAPALDALVEEFGPSILAPDGTLDRAALAAAGFADATTTARMNAIIHPAIGAELLRQVEAARQRADVVVVAIPLFRAEHRTALGVDKVVCVDCPPELAVRRLVEHRGFSVQDAQARIAVQSAREDRLALADEVIENTAGIDELKAAVDALWTHLEVG